MAEIAPKLIALPPDLAERVEAKLRSGRYDTEESVLRESLSALDERDDAMEAWLRDEVAPAYDAAMADPGRAVGLDAVRDRLHAHIGTILSKSRQ
ncbi:hypothetical protein BJF92_09525 [Rhizobium rhizosphaerae]|uniref:Type II toxin-antitoxin system ParD family antitoxin n=1 Tax=Xaviernesmea rhizosphaerae TaxID=1672749 RepID=A0A1Q9AG64_9HYPH|nr:hypothetical protein [Xaviernesmea rhizosphaerae]OLP53978.1 hypothetical protein BJF92_09525 [Xaviernesmea rhizosphaerae]OQP86105.1 hypothetical protein BTR14_11975 [Xaviernesmea rhizosphaerae]